MIERLNAKHLTYIASTKKDFVDAWDYKMLESGIKMILLDISHRIA